MHFKTGSMFINIVSRSLLRLSTRGLSDKCSVRSWSSSSEILPNNMPNYKTLAVSVPKPYVYHIELNRPDKLNALSHNMWLEIYDCFNLLDGNEDCRVVLLSARGRAFTAGLDFSSMMAVAQKLSDVEDVARRCKIVTERLVKYQEAVSALEKCSKPVITLIHGSCIGAGVNFITAADIRYCTEDAVFQLKEVDIGMAADVGALQRLPRVVGSSSIAYELCLTARKMPSSEAKECGLVSRVFKDQKSMGSAGLELAETIAAKSPVAVQVTKRSLVFSRDHSIQEGLNHIAILNMTMLQSEDFMNASVAQATKSPPPEFAKL